MANERMTRVYFKAVIVAALAVFAALVVSQREIPKGLDLRGGSELRYRIKVEGLPEKARAGITQRTIDVIRRRVDPEGNKEIDIRREGKYRFYIQLPGMEPDEAQSIENRIRRAGKLRFCLVNADGQSRDRARKGELIPAHVPYVVAERDKRGLAARWRRGDFSELRGLSEKEAKGWLLVESRPRVTGEYLTDVRVFQGEQGLSMVGFRFKGKGRVLFARVTEENRGKQLAIILDRELYSAPTIRSAITGSGQIEGNFSHAEAQDLVAVLQAGSLPADIELEWNNTVGAQLGEDSIRNGIQASIIALVVVVVFMAGYYLLTGLIADFALMLNLLLVLALMSMMQSVLTLPGIAGLVLTLGMAVDANVLINERIREERNKGKTLGLAIRNGYERAFVTILDSNLTTLITALILFGVGTGPVKGFALTLSFGIVISMFTAIWVTRVLVDLLVELGWLKRLTMLHVLGTGGTRIPFTRIRHWAMAGSLVLIVFGLAMLVRGWEHVKDTDLSGGVRAELELRDGMSLKEFRARVAEVFPGKADVQAVWERDEQQRQGVPRRFSVRVRRLDEAQKEPKMRRDLERILRKEGALGSLERAEEPYVFRARLSRGVSEGELRGWLREHGYLASDIRYVLLVDAAAEDFVIGLRGSALEGKDAGEVSVSKVLDALKAAVPGQDVRVKIGKVVREVSPGAGGAPGKERLHVPLLLLSPASPSAIQEALVRQVEGLGREDEFVVSGAGADEGGSLCREAAVYGARAALEKIAASGRETLTILPFSVVRSDNEVEVRIQTHAKFKEMDIRSQLSEGKVLESLVRSVVPERVEGREYVLALAPLSESKAIEQVREELLLNFEKELSRERMPVELVRADGVPDVAGVEELKKGGYAFYKLKLAGEMQLQSVRTTLLRASTARVALADALLQKAETADEARRPVAEVDLALRVSPAELQELRERIVARFAQPDPFRSIEAIGAVVAGELRNKALLAVFLSWVAIVIYIWFRFGEVKFGLAAVTALVHDVLMTLGAVGVADALSGTRFGMALGFSDIKINVTMIAAFLTLIGYSINDTIVVFDRIRENMGGVRRKVDAALVDLSINQNLSRTLLTSLTTFLVLMVLYVRGGSVIHGFAFVMTFGVLVGTYSSIFIASPILIGWEGFVTGLRRGWRSKSASKS